MKKSLAIILAAAMLFIAGCGSSSKPLTTVPIDKETTTVGDIAGTIEGSRYISHVGGIAFDLTGDYKIDWPNADKRNELFDDYHEIEITGPVITWNNKCSMNVTYVLDEKLKEDALVKHTREEWDSRTVYTVKNIEYIDYKIGDKSYFAIKSLIEYNGKEATALQIYAFQDNGLLVLITITALKYKDAEKIANSLQFA